MFLSDCLDLLDPVFTFGRFMEGIDCKKYLKKVPKHRTGRFRYDPVKMLKTVLFGFMTNGYCSLRELEDNCKVNLRFMYLMDRETPSYRTFGYFINEILNDSIEEIFSDINHKIFKEEKVDLQHLYIDGSKFEANANKYNWVWKKATERSRYRLFKKITALIEEMNETLSWSGTRISVNTDYAPDYLEEISEQYAMLWQLDEKEFVHGKGHHKTIQQRQYELLCQYTEKLKEYVEKIEICGPERNSYSKADHDATFMRIKTDYMGNDQLLPAYNIQAGVADEYIAVVGVNQYRSDMDCFIPLMEQFHQIYGFYPKYPVADAGYGSYNNYIYCEQKRCKKTEKNRTERINEELTSMHQEVIENLESIEGVRLRMNRSIQAEGTFGVMKHDRWYKRIVRRGIKSVRLKVILVSIGHNLYKYHNKKNRISLAAVVA